MTIEAHGQVIATLVQDILGKHAPGTLENLTFQPCEILVRVRRDKMVPGGYAISAEFRQNVNDCGSHEDYENRLREWLTSGDTGVSSQIIFSVMSGSKWIIKDWRNWPHDNADFGRCYRLLERFPEWRDRLKEVFVAFPAWGPMVYAWPELEALYREEHPDHAGSGPKLYARMSVLEDLCQKIESGEN